MTEQNEGQVSEETQGQQAPATQDKTIPMSAYQTLQRDLQKAKDELKQYKGEPTIEEQLTAEREARTAAERRLAVAEAKATAPEVADLVEKFVEKHGVVPDPEILQAMQARVAAAESPRPETSGMRNAPAMSPDQREEARVKDILSKERLWD